MSKNVSGSGRDKWSTGFGFIMSAAGSAVGLGNIWKFPYVCGTGGGALFLAVYIFFKSPIISFDFFLSNIPYMFLTM